MSDFRSFWQRRVGVLRGSGPTFSASVSKNPSQRVELHAVVDYDPDIQLVVVRTETGGGSLEDDWGRTRPNRGASARGSRASGFARAVVQELRRLGVPVWG